MKNSKTARSFDFGSSRKLVIGFAVSALLLVSACGDNTSAGDATQDNGEGFEYGATQEEVNEVIADLDPVTLTLQLGEASESVEVAQFSLLLKEAVEERSNGQIEFEVAFGHSIAGPVEAVDALADGRVDISYVPLTYEPQRFPEHTALGNALGNLEYSPLVGEMVAHAVGSELAWSNEALMGRFEEANVTPLAPLVATGANSLSCNSPVSRGEDFQGKQIRSATSGQSDVISQLGGSPASLEFAETYEALQRGTIDCDLSAMAVKHLTGTYDVAPHISYTTAAGWPRSPGAFLAGSSFDELPLPYQQIIFDSGAWGVTYGTGAAPFSTALLVDAMAGVDGTMTEMGDDFQSELANALTELQEADIDAGILPEDITTQVTELEDKWTARIADLGYEEQGEMTEMNEWYDTDPDSIEDFWEDFTWDVYENSGALDHRPGNNG